MHRPLLVTMRSFLLAAFLGATGAVAPATAHAEDAPTSRVRIEDRGPNRLLLATGIATLGFSYSVSAYVGATSSFESERFLLVPAAGPFLALAERERDSCASTSGPCPNESTYEGLLVASGVMQLAGVLQIGLAFVARERREVERPVVMPLALRGGGGVGAVAKF